MTETVEECVRKTVADLIDQVCTRCSPPNESEDITSVDDDVDVWIVFFHP